MTNHMKEVAKLLGVELRETFKIADDIFGEHPRYYRFAENVCLEASNDGVKWETADAGVLEDILLGDVRIIKLPWKPREDERYFYPLPSDKGLWGGSTWTDSNYDNIRLNRGLVLKTREEAIAVAEKMLAITQEKNEARQNDKMTNREKAIADLIERLKPLNNRQLAGIIVGTYDGDFICHHCIHNVDYEWTRRNWTCRAKDTCQGGVKQWLEQEKS